MLGSDRDGAIGSTNDGTFVIEGIGVPEVEPDSHEHFGNCY